jgi:hypothetical protein
VYTPGEEIGTASNYNRTTRTNKPLTEDSFVRVNVLSNGVQASDAFFKVSYSFSDPSLNYKSYGVVKENGDVYVEIPPDEYDVIATVTADNYENSGGLTITSDEYYTSKAAGQGYIKSGTITTGPKKSDYCNSDGICQRAESSSCSDCALPQVTRVVTPPPSGGTPAQQTASQQASDNTALGIVLALVLVLVIVIIAIVALVSRKKS